jgi:hypothetical protein
MVYKVVSESIVTVAKVGLDWSEDDVRPLTELIMFQAKKNAVADDSAKYS